MTIRSRIITAAIGSSLLYLFFNAPAQSQSEYERQLNRAVERNQAEMRLRLERELAPSPQPQYFYTPDGRPLGYIESGRGEANMFSNDGQWIGTVPGGR